MNLLLNYIIWDVDPQVHFGDAFSVRWYSLLFATLTMVGILMLYWFMQREKAPKSDFFWIVMVTVCSGFVGARLVHVFFYDPTYFLAHPWEIPMVWKGGLASHGGALGIVVGIYLYSKYKGKIWYWWIYDRIAIFLALGSAFIRVGNLMNSELYGKITNVPWAFVFTAVDKHPRHPVQLYEVGYLIPIFILMLWLYLKTDFRKMFGVLTGIFLILLTLSRIGAEYFKEYETVLWDMNMGQLLSIPFLLMGVVVLVLGLKGKLQ